ncbi:hypothetical protein C8R44DRAFT_748236 [Mycena epipterygia]|nr:hypothetical protein C8R44DRAFT_748236 [Mycena epipterygia]
MESTRMETPAGVTSLTSTRAQVKMGKHLSILDIGAWLEPHSTCRLKQVLTVDRGARKCVHLQKECKSVAYFIPSQQLLYGTPAVNDVVAWTVNALGPPSLLGRDCALTKGGLASKVYHSNIYAHMVETLVVHRWCENKSILGYTKSSNVVPPFMIINKLDVQSTASHRWCRMLMHTRWPGKKDYQQRDKVVNCCESCLKARLGKYRVAQCLYQGLGGTQQEVGGWNSILLSTRHHTTSSLNFMPSTPLSYQQGGFAESYMIVLLYNIAIRIMVQHGYCKGYMGAQAIRSTQAKWPSKLVAGHEADRELVARQLKGKGNKSGLTVIDARVVDNRKRSQRSIVMDKVKDSQDKVRSDQISSDKLRSSLIRLDKKSVHDRHAQFSKIVYPLDLDVLAHLSNMCMSVKYPFCPSHMHQSQFNSGHSFSSGVLLASS